MIKFILAVSLILHGLANLGGVAAFLFGASAGFPNAIAFSRWIAAMVYG